MDGRDEEDTLNELNGDKGLDDPSDVKAEEAYEEDHKPGDSVLEERKEDTLDVASLTAIG